MSHSALAKLHVVDLSTSAAGAWCSRLLADFGAEAMMVESPQGHPLRQLAPFTAHGESIPALYFLANKRSIALDLTKERERLQPLIQSADILISSATPSQLSASHLTYTELNQPSLIMAHLTPHGMTGALADVCGNDLTTAARSGWASINGAAAREPLKPSGWQAAYCAGIAAYSAILAALYHRQQTNEGQELDIAEVEVMLANFAPAFLRSQYNGQKQWRRAEFDLMSGPLPVADGHFALTISRGHFWTNAMQLLGLPDLAEDPRWQTNWYRQQHKDEYLGRVIERMRAWKKQALFDGLAARRVVAGPVLTMAELAQNAQLRARNFWTPLDGIEYPGAPFKMSATPWQLKRGAPKAGEHTINLLDPPRYQVGKSDCPSDLHQTRREGQQTKNFSSHLRDSTSGPLSGLRGLVLTQAWAGTYCTELLGLMGADIIQVEVTKRLDSWRGTYDAPMPAALKTIPTAQHAWNCNPLYNSVNLNKRCVTLDLQTPEGLAVFKRLLPHADFVAENFTPRVLGNLGIDYEVMKSIKPDIILCSLSAYGHDGPWSNVPGIGGTIEPTSGMSAVLGYRDGAPINSGQMYPDAVAGLYACAAILTALHQRNRTGEGQYIDLSMQEANLTLVGDAALEYMLTGRQRERMGNWHTTFAPHGIYPCEGREQWLALACEDETQWQTLCALAGMNWASDERFTKNEKRKINEDALDETIAQWTRAQSRDALAAQLSAMGVFAAPVWDADELARNEHFRARGIIVEVDHPETGRWLQVTNPLRFSLMPACEVRPSPLLGEHSYEVFSQLLSMSREEYEALVKAGVSGTEQPQGIQA
jgi:crotonobetainyl-CoA:carnitine CoA-transferase CaiB-like acyl-CoA transferase